MGISCNLRQSINFIRLAMKFLNFILLLGVNSHYLVHARIVPAKSHAVGCDYEHRDESLVRIKKESTGSYEAMYEKAVAILSEYPVIDGHNDFAWSVRDLYKNDLTNLNFNSNLTEDPVWEGEICHTDLPKLREGHVGGQFWSAYVGCDSQYKDALLLFIEQIDVIKRLAQDYSDDLAFVTDSKGLEKAISEKKIGSMIGIESGHAIGNSLATLRNLYELGARYITLTHMCNTPWADAAQAEQGVFPERNDGITAFGEEVIKEMNRIGMLVDLAHVSRKVMSDVLNVTRAPVIFSHSSARGVYNHVRNVPDDILLRVKENEGIVMVNFFSCYVTNCNEKVATVEDVAAHINYIRDLIGVDYIGLGSDFNGVPETPEGLEDASKYPNLFAVLLTHGWNEEDLGKLASGNLLRTWKKVEQVRDSLVTETPGQKWIPIEDLRPTPFEDTKCMSDNY